MSIVDYEKIHKALILIRDTQLFPCVYMSERVCVCVNVSECVSEYMCKWVSV